MKNLKTTVGGAAGGLALVATGIKLLTEGQTEAGLGMVVSGLGVLWGLYHAQDAKRGE
jgi:hypothetical protein